MDGLRSPLTIRRDAGAPEYQGEVNPDPAKYQNNELTWYKTLTFLWRKWRNKRQSINPQLSSSLFGSDL